MLSLCQPYGPTITCLCDEAASVLRCFITKEEGDRDNYMQEDMVPVTSNIWSSTPDHQQSGSRVQDDKMLELKTEIIIAGAIVIVIIGIICM